MGKQWLWSQAKTGVARSGRLVATLMAVSGLAFSGLQAADDVPTKADRGDAGGLTVPLRNGNGYVQVPVAATAQASAGDATALPLAIPGAPRGRQPMMRNRVLLPLSVDEAAVAEQYGLTLVSGVLHGNMIEVQGATVLETVEAVQQMSRDGIIDWSEMQVDNLYVPFFTPNDSLFNEQVHLNGDAEADISTVAAWDTANGEGVVVGIIDSGVEFTHEDLVGNSRLDLHFDYYDNDTDPQPETADEAHGTAVAGTAVAVGNNTIGVASPAYRADFASLRVGTDADGYPSSAIINALVHNSTASNADNQMWVTNNSYGRSPFIPFSTSPGRAAAYEEAANNGRGGRGTVMVYASGNDRDFGLSRDWGDSSRYIAIVGALSNFGTFAGYSNPGHNLLVSAAGGDARSGAGIVTVDRSGTAGYAAGNYAVASDNVQGTSFASPVVAGVAAMMLDARPQLTWRDVMEILARTATRNDASNSSWFTNGAGLHFSPDYGFGNVNAELAVQESLSWRLLPQEQAPLIDQQTINQTIPDGVISGVTQEFSINPDPRVVYVAEYVEVDLSVQHNFIGDLVVTLTSPSGTEVRIPRPAFSGIDLDHTFGFQCFRGEQVAGQWTLNVADIIAIDEGVLEQATVRVYGYDASRLPFISSLSNPSLAVQNTSFEMSIFGSNFEESSIVVLQHPVFGERQIVPTFISTERLDVEIPASFLSAPGSFSLRVQNTEEDVSAPVTVDVVFAPLVSTVFVEINGFMTETVEEAWYSVDGGSFITLPLGDSNDYQITETVPARGSSVEIEIMGRTASGVVVRRTVDVAQGADS